MKQGLEQWDVKEKVTERIERSRLYNDYGIIDIIVTSFDETGTGERSMPYID